MYSFIEVIGFAFGVVGVLCCGLTAIVGFIYLLEVLAYHMDLWKRRRGR